MQQVTPAIDGTANMLTASAAVCFSAGCGRTGVICALDYIYDLLVTKVTHVNKIVSLLFLIVLINISG